MIWAKECKRCKEWKPAEEYFTGGNGTHTICKSCKDLFGNLLYFIRGLHKKYGIDDLVLLEAYRAQNGLCKICKRPNENGRELALDHNHETGAFRGFLCGRCNIGLGCFSDDSDRLVAAASYLKENS